MLTYHQRFGDFAFQLHHSEGLHLVHIVTNIDYLLLSPRSVYFQLDGHFSTKSWICLHFNKTFIKAFNFNYLVRETKSQQSPPIWVFR